MTVTPLYRRLEPEGVVDGDTDDDDDDDGNCNGDRDGDLAVKDVRLDDLAFNEPVLRLAAKLESEVKVYGTELLLSVNSSRGGTSITVISFLQWIFHCQSKYST